MRICINWIWLFVLFILYVLSYNGFNVLCFIKDLLYKI